MWNFVNTMGHPGHFMAPYNAQKRNFSFQVPNVSILPGKGFTNPNFVNKHLPSVHSYQNNFISTPIEKISHFDSSETISPLINSSQSIVDTIKKRHLDICKTVQPKSEIHSSASMCFYNRKPNKRNRKQKHNMAPRKSSKQNIAKQQINDIMEVEMEPECMSAQDVSMSPRVPSNIFNLTDLIKDKPTKAAKCSKIDKYSDEEDLESALISLSPCGRTNRERQTSVCESEDSFIVFDSGTDEELDFSEESELSEDSEDDSESEDDDDDDDDSDSPSSVIPYKRVRFADEEGLCEIHPMVQWSYAYQQARKGPWEEYARDRDRFNKRIGEAEKTLSEIFDARHREKIYNERFLDCCL